MKRTIATETINIDIQYLEFFSQPQQGRVTAYLLKGYEDENGIFHEAGRETLTIKGADYSNLMAGNPEGKIQGRFRNDDVLAKVDEIRARE